MDKASTSVSLSRCGKRIVDMYPHKFPCLPRVCLPNPSAGDNLQRSSTTLSIAAILENWGQKHSDVITRARCQKVSFIMASDGHFNHKTSGLKVARRYATDIFGKICLVTGVSPEGLGAGIARAFAYGGASMVILTGRNVERLFEVANQISSEYPRTIIRPIILNLSSLRAVKVAGEGLLADRSIPHIDIIVGNAATHTFNNERDLTGDGIETHFGTNHIGHFLFITSLFPKLRIAAAKDPVGATRIIMMTSGAMALNGIRFHDWNFDGHPIPLEERTAWWMLQDHPARASFDIQETDRYHHYSAYAQSKTANTLFALHLNTILAAYGIFAFAVNPGFVRTDGAAEQMLATGFDRDAQTKLGFWKSIDQGSATVMVAAADPSLTPEDCLVLADCQVVNDDKLPRHARSREAAEKLWVFSEKIVKWKLGPLAVRT